MTDLPQKPTLDGLEVKWSEFWDRQGVYGFDRTRSRDEVYAIDTPPPTVSGYLHVGHVFSYTQTDTVARYQRMRGKMVLYPMGWDDNGLATERRVQNHFGVRCDPSLPYDPGFTTPSPLKEKEKRPTVSLSRQNFIEVCLGLVVDDEAAFEALWRKLGLSIDWSLTYSSIDKRAQRVSQRAFLRNLKRGEAYQAEAPTLWDVDFQTAVAQAELEDRPQNASYHRICFRRVGKDGQPGEPVYIETTRPELLPACVALVANPDDERYKPLFGTEVLTPLFGVKVPVVAHPLAEPEKGSGIAMICTFGDLTDVIWWRELKLPTRTVVQRDGRLGELDFSLLPCADPAAAAFAYSELEGKRVKQAQGAIVELLQASGDIVGEPKPITHPVKFYEKGDRPLEIVSSRQWFITTLDHREAFIERGRQIEWHPPYMRARYEDWVNGLNSDWLVSRQRFFGVPFPIWYRLDDDGEVVLESPLLPDEADLPIDPSSDTPPGYTDDQRGRPGGFTADPDVMDTWATSSLTPQLVTGWEEDEALFSRTFPMDLRPQAHEIIRTWLFYSVVRAELESDTIPWRHAALSGWVLDPERKKMSKSLGNTVTPLPLLEKHGSDAVRYWATSARLGVDTAFDANQMKVGRRLAIKLLNASKFVLSFADTTTGEAPAAPTERVDLALLARLAETVSETTAAFDAYDSAKALDRTEAFFWSFCDDYLELVKGRAYGGQGDGPGVSATTTLRVALSVIQRLLAPFLAFAAEEAWSWWQEGSVHQARWPTPSELPVGDETDEVLVAAAAVLAEVRRAKSEAKVSQRAVAEQVTVRADETTLAHLGHVVPDLREAGSITDLILETGEWSVSVTLAETA